MGKCKLTPRGDASGGCLRDKEKETERRGQYQALADVQPGALPAAGGTRKIRALWKTARQLLTKRQQHTDSERGNPSPDEAPREEQLRLLNNLSRSVHSGCVRNCPQKDKPKRPSSGVARPWDGRAQRHEGAAVDVNSATESRSCVLRERSQMEMPRLFG